MPIKVTRALLTAALDGSLRNGDFRTDRYFGFAVPTSLPGVEPHILDPIKTWADKAEFDKTARALVGMFQKNFAKFGLVGPGFYRIEDVRLDEIGRAHV